MSGTSAAKERAPADSLFGMRVLLAAFSVLLSLLSLPGGRWPFLALISLVPLGFALYQASRLECFLLAYGYGLAGWFGATGGLISGLSSYAHVSPEKASVILVLASAWMAIPYGAFGFLSGTWQWMTRPGDAWKAAGCLTLLVIAFPNPLPIDSSHALAAFPVLIQILDLGGQPLLLFALYLFNWLLLDLCLRLWQHQKWRSSLASLVGIAGLVIGYGYFRLAQFHREEDEQLPARTLRIALIQPNIPLTGDSDPTSEDEMNPFHALLAQTADAFAAGAGVDLVVWPETPQRITCYDGSGIRPELTAMAARCQVAFLINCVQPAPGRADYNTELLITASGQALAYHKRILFAFTEYLPAVRWFPGLRSLLPGAARYSPGRETIVFPITNSLRVFPATCYEILFRRHPRDFLRAGGNILVSPANDAWFGASRIPEFQIAEAALQAVQYRVPVVRVSNSGNSVALRATGEIVPQSRTLPFTKTTRLVQVFVPDGRAPYFFLGDWFLYLLAGAWSFSVLRSLGKTNSRDPADNPVKAGR